MTNNNINKTLVSIITVNYNNKNGLLKTIKSVISQTYSNIEFIIIDGASSDGSKELIKDYIDFLTYWVSEKDNGIYDAMNKGIVKAKGKYCLFLNSGDYFCNSKILSDIFNNNTYDVDLLIGRQKFINNNGKISFAPKLRVEEINMSFFLSSTLPHQATFIKRDLLNKIGMYNTDYRIVSDCIFWIEAIVKEKCTFSIIPQFISYMETGGVSNNIDKCRIEMGNYFMNCLLEGSLTWDDIFKCTLKSRQQEWATRLKIMKFINRLMIWIGKHY